MRLRIAMTAVDVLNYLEHLALKLALDVVAHELRLLLVRGIGLRLRRALDDAKRCATVGVGFAPALEHALDELCATFLALQLESR